MPIFARKRCCCGTLEICSKEPNSPIRWDEAIKEYYIGEALRLAVHYCPHCGGRTPKSRRASPYAHVTMAEEFRIQKLFIGVRTVADVLTRFGQPDEEQDPVSAVRHVRSLFLKRQHGEVFRGLIYKKLSPVADVIFEVGVGDSVKGSWIQKYVGESKG